MTLKWRSSQTSQPSAVLAGLSRRCTNDEGQTSKLSISHFSLVSFSLSLSSFFLTCISIHSCLALSVSFIPSSSVYTRLPLIPLSIPQSSSASNPSPDTQLPPSRLWLVAWRRRPRLLQRCEKQSFCVAISSVHNAAYKAAPIRVVVQVVERSTANKQKALETGSCAGRFLASRFRVATAPKLPAFIVNCRTSFGYEAMSPHKWMVTRPETSKCLWPQQQARSRVPEAKESRAFPRVEHNNLEAVCRCSVRTMTRGCRVRPPSTCIISGA